MNRVIAVFTTGLLLVGLGSSVQAAQAAFDDQRVGSPAIAAVPGSRGAGYGTSVVVAQPGDDITFVNSDAFVHDVRSVAMGPDNTTWCKPWDPGEPQHPKRNPRQFPKGRCPLLWTLPISVTVGAVETKVFGTQNLKPGSSVEFYCTVFPEMRGTVVVL
jgi:plastocyanin